MKEQEPQFGISNEAQEVSQELEGQINTTIADRIKRLKKHLHSLDLEADEAEYDINGDRRFQTKEVLHQFMQLQKVIKDHAFPQQKIETLFMAIEDAYEKLNIVENHEEK